VGKCDGAAALEIGDDGDGKLFSEQVFFQRSDLRFSKFSDNRDLGIERVKPMKGAWYNHQFTLDSTFS
jgi:hypothetical protein